MNLIVCNKKCKHQADGYCCLNKITSITDNTESGCCYFVPSDAILDNTESACDTELTP